MSFSTDSQLQNQMSAAGSRFRDLCETYPPETVLLRIVKGMADRNDLAPDKAEHYLEIAGLALDALPLGSDDYELAANRISNANRYYRRRIPAAARFELRALHGKLQRQLEC